MSQSLCTPLHAWHIANGGRIVDFAGWQMPIQYSSIIAEHENIRTQVGLFDVSHMGRLFLSGSNAADAIAAVVTCDVKAMSVGRVRYGLVLNEHAGIIDDVLVSRLGEDDWLVVANASGREQVRELLGASIGSGVDATLDDRTLDLAMLAIQGPRASAVVDSLFDEGPRPSSLRYYRTMDATSSAGLAMTVSRTGYTGEDGFELIFPADAAEAIADELLAHDVSPAGLGARDTLRLEAGMPLYGQDLSLQVDPKTAGLEFAVRDHGGFHGAEALQQREPVRRRIGLRFEGKRPVRAGAELFVADQLVGSVTSGTLSPTLSAPIAMGYVDLGATAAGTAIEAEVRGQRVPGSVVDLPFYKRAH